MSAPDAAPPSDAPAPTPSGKSVPLALILAVVAGLAVGGGTGFFAVGPALATGIAPAVTANAKHAKASKPAAGDHGDDAESDDEGGHGEAAEDEESGEEAAKEGEHGKEGAAAGAPVYTLDNLVLNPAQSGGTRFLLLTISFELAKAETVDAMKARDAELRDLVLVTVGNKTVEQLSDVAARDSLKAELKTAATKLFKKRAVKRVYFPQFVIQ